MSTNIFLVIRQDIANVSAKIDALRADLPDVGELNTKLDAQSAQLTTIEGQVTEIIDTLNPVIPPVDPPTVPAAGATPAV
ncbi:P10 [Operophtera brumata nucleopolyhedrovirus]|uniref:P10 n=1 Tax=Operophtera brumata nucleopolyhedrovirus TaxID=1046267 RepID=A0A2H4UZM9_9ABAC|nr:P10 [Operophtera brumata nucleopolyhedrovirus]AUA60253.1 P10 [Operophtera brumata nucleopolyhedrovirus]